MKKCLFSIVAALFIASSYAADGTVSMPDFQREFLQIVLDYSAKYPKAGNELQKSALLTERLEKWKTLKGDPRKISGWVGVLEKLGTNGDGNAYISVVMPNMQVRFSTWNNSFSDIDDRSLIKQSSPLFKKLAQMKEGNVVRFNGRLKRPKNMTEEGKMVTPDFLFIFSDVEKVGDSLR